MQTFQYVGGSHTRGSGRQTPQPSRRGNRGNRLTGRGQVVPNRPAVTPQVARPPAQRGRGFQPSGQSWGQTGGNNTSFAGGTCWTERLYVGFYGKLQETRV